MENEQKEKKAWTYKDWYSAHAKELSERRRARYESDPEYKKKILEQNRLYREKKAREDSARPKPMIRVPKRRKPVIGIVPINGKQTPVQLVHIGAFARAIQRSVPTIHQWERNGLLPRTPFFVDSKNKQERLYTSDMIGVVKKAVESRNGTVSVSDGSFHVEIVSGWSSAGIDIENSFAVTKMVEDA